MGYGHCFLGFWDSGLLDWAVDQNPRLDNLLDAFINRWDQRGYDFNREAVEAVCLSKAESLLDIEALSPLFAPVLEAGVGWPIRSNFQNWRLPNFMNYDPSVDEVYGKLREEGGDGLVGAFFDWRGFGEELDGLVDYWVDLIGLGWLEDKTALKKFIGGRMCRKGFCGLPRECIGPGLSILNEFLDASLREGFVKFSPKIVSYLQHFKKLLRFCLRHHGSVGVWGFEPYEFINYQSFYVTTEELWRKMFESGDRQCVPD